MTQRILPFVKRQVSNTTFSTSFLINLFKAEQEGLVQEGVTRNIYRDVLNDLIPIFKLEIITPSTKRQQYSYMMYDRADREVKLPSLMEGNDLACLIDHCRSMGLIVEQESILGKLLSGANTVDVSAFGTLLIPFLTHLLKLLNLDKTSTHDPVIRFFFQRTIDTYVRRYVNLESSKPSDWSQPRRGCDCADDRELDIFLIDPKQKVGRFAVNKKRRGHLHDRLNSTECTHETERRGSPQTLVVTKTHGAWQKTHRVWQQRCKTASQIFYAMGLQALENLLGERYGELVGLEAVKLGSAARYGTRPATIGGISSSEQYSAMAKVQGQGTYRKDIERMPLETITQPRSQDNDAKPDAYPGADRTSKYEIIDLCSD